MLCVIHQWQDWHQIREGVVKVKQAVDTMPTTKHVVYVFKNNIEVPKPWSLPLIAQFLETLHATGHTSVLVNAPRQLRVFVRMAQQVYDSDDTQPGVVFVDALTDLPYTTPATAVPAR